MLSVNFEPTAGNAVHGGRPPLTERALAALTDRAASRLAHTLSKCVSPSVGTKCGSRAYRICRTAPDGVVTSWRDHFQQRGEKPALLRPGDRRSPADSAPLPRDGRHRGARAATSAIRARGAVQQCGRDLQPKYPAPSPRPRRRPVLVAFAATTAQYRVSPSSSFLSWSVCVWHTAPLATVHTVHAVSVSRRTGGFLSLAFACGSL